MTTRANHAPTVEAELPRLVRVRQLFPSSPALDVERTVHEALRQPAATLRPGSRVAVAVGSRGITDLDLIVATAIEALKSAGARPFLVPAMGSHGGGTADGQRALLVDLGVSEGRLGVPMLDSMDTVQVGATEDGMPVLVSVEALRADAILLVSRVKPHTDFTGGIGSGLLKMLVVGLGKRAGAAGFHRAAAAIGHERVLRRCARVLGARLPLLGGLAVIENQRHATAQIEFVAPENFESREEALCAQATTLMPTLPFTTIDLLVVDWMGKNISGTGMDPAVIGRMVHGYSLNESSDEPAPRVRRLFVRGLTPESRGNAIGLGLADFTTDRLVRAMDARITALNAVTALSLQAAKVPIHFPSDLETIRCALGTLPIAAPNTARVVHIRDTLSVEQFEASEACLNLPEAAGRLETCGEPQAMRFDTEGNLLPFQEQC